MRLQGGRVEIVGAQARRPREDRGVGIAHRPAPVRARVVASEAIGRPARHDHAVHAIAGRDHDGMRARLADDASPVVLLIRERQRPCPRRLDHLDARIGGKRREARDGERHGTVTAEREFLDRRLRARPQTRETGGVERERLHPRDTSLRGSPADGDEKALGQRLARDGGQKQHGQDENDAASQRHHDLPS